MKSGGARSMNTVPDTLIRDCQLTNSSHGNGVCASKSVSQHSSRHRLSPFTSKTRATCRGDNDRITRMTDGLCLH